MWRLSKINKLLKSYKIMNILKKFWHSIATRFIPQTLCASVKNKFNKIKYNRLLLIRFVKTWIFRKLEKIIFMVTYRKQFNSFNFNVIVDNIIIGEYSGKFTYGTNKTIFDSFIEVEFIPYPIITSMKLFKIPNNFNPIIKVNIENDVENQINVLLDNFINKIKTENVDYSIIEKRKSYNLWLNTNHQVEIMLIYENTNNVLEKLAVIQPNQEVLKFTGETDDDHIVSTIYDIVK